jgi:predicted  nucleic acid-binding Zn-ribbon protein
MNADLERLIELQRLDSTAHDARRRLSDEPDRQRALESRVEEARLKVTAAKERLADNQNARRLIEKEVAVHQGRLSKFREQAMAVKTNQEYHAIQHEIAFADAEVKKLEEQILERMLEADDLTAAAKEAETALASTVKEADAEKRAIAAENTQLTQALEKIAAERALVTSGLTPQVLATFELVAKRRNGVGLAEARDGICTICHVRLRPQVFNTVLRNEEIMQCDHCQRILYFVPRAAAAAPDAAHASAPPAS